MEKKSQIKNGYKCNWEFCDGAGPRWGRYYVGPVQFLVCFGTVIGSTLLAGQTMKVSSISRLHVHTWSHCTHHTENFGAFSRCTWYQIHTEQRSSTNSWSSLESSCWCWLRFHPFTRWGTSTSFPFSSVLLIALVPLLVPSMQVGGQVDTLSTIYWYSLLTRMRVRRLCWSSWFGSHGGYCDSFQAIPVVPRPRTIPFWEIVKTVSLERSTLLQSSPLLMGMELFQKYRFYFSLALCNVCLAETISTQFSEMQQKPVTAVLKDVNVHKLLWYISLLRSTIWWHWFLSLSPMYAGNSCSSSYRKDVQGLVPLLLGGSDNVLQCGGVGILGFRKPGTGHDSLQFHRGRHHSGTKMVPYDDGYLRSPPAICCQRGMHSTYPSCLFTGVIYWSE